MAISLDVVKNSTPFSASRFILTDTTDALVRMTVRETDSEHFDSVYI